MTRGWVLNEIFRRVDPERRTMGEFLRQDVCGPLGVQAYFGVEEKYLDITEDIEDEIEEIEERRAAVADEVDELLLEVEELREEAAQIRHRFDGLKIKYRVLRNDTAEASALKEIQDQLRELQQEFNLRKQLTMLSSRSTSDCVMVT